MSANIENHFENRAAELKAIYGSILKLPAFLATTASP